MTHLTVLTAVLLSSSMLAATEPPDTHSQSPQCRALEERIDGCQSNTRLSRETRDSCDRIEAAFMALCGPLGTIGASASAAGGALDLLRQDYRVVPIEKTAAGVFPRHLVIGPADLDDPQLIALLKRSYRYGKTVAIADATEHEARRFHSLLRPGEGANCQPAKGQADIPLYGLQRSRYRMPPQNSSYCLINLDPQDPGADRRWLRERFALKVRAPAVGKVTATSSALTAASDENPTQFLTGLATATHCSSKMSNGSGAIEADAYVYAMRSFTDTGCGSCQHVGADYYLVQDNLTYEKNSSNVTSFDVASPTPVYDSNQGAQFTPGSYNLEFTDPVTTTTVESSYSNSSSVTVSGSVGLTADGPNVTAGGSLTTSQATTYNVPPTTILNKSNLKNAMPWWLFTPQNLPVGTDFEAYPTWTWFIPRDAYPSGGTGNGNIQFYNYADIYANNANVGYMTGYCTVPYPFSAWTVNPPQLLSLGSGSTQINGGQFTITGQYLYPSSVVAVLIGGTPVNLDTNVDLVDDTTIDVTVPGGYFPGTHKVQVNTQFNGQNMFSNELDLTLTD